MSFFFMTTIAVIFRTVYSQCLHSPDVECSAQAANLGTHSTIESCAWASALNPQCGDYFMFSESYSSWGCRCCSPNGGEVGGSSNTNWDIFSVEGCGATKPPTPSPTSTTTTSPITTPTNSCYDYQRGGCWDSGFVDYKSDASGCQRYCAMTPGCNYWSYHPLRGDKRCHLCSHDADWSTCDDEGSCIWGPASCPGDDTQNATTMFYGAVDTAKSFCSGTTPTVTAEDMLIAAESMNILLGNMESYFVDIDTLSDAADSAAEILDDSECMDSLTACDFSGVLMLQLRGFLLVFDDDADRAFPDSTDLRKEIWNRYRVLVADNGFLDGVSLNAIGSFFSDLPAHLLSDGVLFDAPFATMTVRDAFKCGSDDSAGSILGGFTNRGFNVFKNQVGDTVENAFPSDSDRVYGDLMMTVLRHETSHQFDRVVDADDRLLALETLLQSASDSDDDYLRSQVGHDYFESAPQEIIASQVGNQYFLDTAAQLRLAIDRFQTTPLPLSWIVFFFDVIGGSTSSTTTFYREQSSTTGVTETATALIVRDDMDRIIGLTVPGCDPFAFEYGANGLIESYSGPTDCVVDFDVVLTTPTPTVSATTFTPTVPTPTDVQCLFESERQCGSQAINLGAHDTAESCAWSAALDSQCGEYIMFSANYPSWGCRCCSPNGGEIGGSSNTNWDLYSVEGCALSFMSDDDSFEADEKAQSELGNDHITFNEVALITTCTALACCCIGGVAVALCFWYQTRRNKIGATGIEEVEMEKDSGYDLRPIGLETTDKEVNEQEIMIDVQVTETND